MGGEADSGEADWPMVCWWTLVTDEELEALEDELDELEEGMISSVFWLLLLLMMSWVGEEAEHGWEVGRFWLRSNRAFFSGCRPGWLQIHD